MMAKKAAAAASQMYEVSPRVARQASVRPYQRERGAPLVRPLRIYTLDPSVSARLGGVATAPVPYEKLEPGPSGSVFHVVADGVPAPLSAEALNLDDPALLMSCGLTPTPMNGRFHLQMVYAVCSITYAAFRKALGRDIAWATTPPEGAPLRLTVRPFGFRGPNAGYSREAGDLSFGYFSAGRNPAGFVMRKGLISTALSHDIIAHETTHALLDGLRSLFAMPTNIDVPAFHEGFSDLVALFLHFSYAEVVERGIRESRGATTRGSLITDLAREFGYARSRAESGAALRSGVDVEGVAGFDSDVPLSKTDRPLSYDEAGSEPHQLGTVLVSAVFEAFTTVVRRKTERLFSIAGIDPAAANRGPISDALVKAIAQEASDVAGQFLNICIRGIDYCPPADMEFGEYLRAMITADSEMEQGDKWGFREALMRSFRRRCIFPDHVQFMTEDAMRWRSPDQRMRIPGLSFCDLRFDGEPGRAADVEELNRQAHALGAFVTDPRHAKMFQLVSPGTGLPKGITYASIPAVESVRVSRRVAPDGRVLFDLVAEVTQSCTVRRDGDLFDVNGGCTLIIDPEGEVRFAISKRFDSEARRARQHAAMRGPLRKFWKKTGRQFTVQKDILRRLHGSK
jgi:hypothetical protein